MCCVCVGDGRGPKGYNEDYTDSVIAGWPIVPRLQNVVGYKASLVFPDRLLWKRKKNEIDETGTQVLERSARGK